MDSPVGSSFGAFSAIQYVGTPLALVAFIVAVVGYVYRARLAERRKMIESAPEQDRARVLEATIRDFSEVSLEDLTKDQRYQLALKLIDDRRSRFRTTTLFSLALAVLLAVTVLLLGRTEAGTGTSLTVRLHGPGGPADAINRGSVTLDAGEIRLNREIGPDGQARFENLAGRTFEHGISITPNVPGLRPASATTFTSRPAGGAVTIAMVADTAIVTGTVLDDPEHRFPLAGVVLDFGSGLAVDTTDAHGNFRVALARAPGDRVPLKLYREGKTGFDDAVTVAPGHELTLYFGRSDGP